MSKISDNLYRMWKATFEEIMDNEGIMRMELAKECDVSRQSVYNWLNQGWITGTQFLASYSAMKILLLRRMKSGEIKNRESVSSLLELNDYYLQHGLRDMNKGQNEEVLLNGKLE